MEKDIVWKLNEEFKLDITSERQVVYILVELRKLLELKGTLDDYWTLKVCCDWAVHPEMSWKTAQTIVKYFDDYEDKYRRENVGVSQAGMPELTGFVEHATFRAELIAVCDRYGITSGFLDDDWWRSFVSHYSEVVKDCPFVAKADNTKYVTKVTAQAVSPAGLGIFHKRLGIMWLWERRDIDTPGNVTSLF